ncbi:hypothetical protein CAJAP_00493 [Camponotus japonicus]
MGYRYARNAIFGYNVAAPFVDECSTCVSSLNRHGDPFLFLLSFSSNSPIQSPVAGPWGTHGCGGSRAVVAAEAHKSFREVVAPVGIISVVLHTNRRASPHLANDDINERLPCAFHALSDALFVTSA